VAGKTSLLGGFQHQAGVLIADNIAQCFGELPEFSQAAIQLR